MHPKKNATENAPAFMTRRQLAARWQVSQETLKRRERAGTLPSYRLGQGARYAVADVLKIESAARIGGEAR